MNEELDLETLGVRWRHDDGAGVDLGAFRAELRRRNRRTAWVVAAEMLVTAVLLAWTFELVSWGLHTPLLVAWSWTFWAAAAGLAWWNRAGQIRRSVDSPAEFARVSMARARAKIRVVWIVASLCMVQLGFVLTYEALVSSGGPPAPTVAFILVAGFLTAVWGWRYRRDARRELREYEAICVELDEGEQSLPLDAPGQPT